MKWTLETRKINELHDYEKNARKIHKDDAAQLRESLDRFGQCEPVVINTDGTIIGGHQRTRTLRKMGHKTIDVYVPSVTLEAKEVEELNIRLNRNTGGWDYDILGNAWDPSDLVQWGFTPNELHLQDVIDKMSGTGDDPKPVKCSMTITFTDIDHLQEAEDRISTIVDEYSGAYYKIKAN